MINIKEFYAGRKIVVTGGAGFIGSFLIEALVAVGARVSVLVKPSTDIWRLTGSVPNISIFPVDLNQIEAVKKFFADTRPSIVFNLAALVNTKQDPILLESILRENFQNVFNLLRAAVDSNVDRFVQMGTNDEYGMQSAPFLETQHEMPISPYALSKTLSTHSLLFFHRSLGLDTRVVRPAAAYGPRQWFGMLIPNLIRAGIEKKDFPMNPGEQYRDFVYIEDLVDGILRIGAAEQGAGEIINFGSGRPRGYKIKDVALMLNRLMGDPVKITFGVNAYRALDVMEAYADCQKAQRLLGWKATTDLETGLQKTIRWYKEHTDVFEKLAKH